MVVSSLLTSTDTCVIVIAISPNNKIKITLGFSYFLKPWNYDRVFHKE